MSRISAVVLAAGLSTRMGVPKLVLPWQKSTIIQHVVWVLSASGVEDILVVTGGAQVQVKAALEGENVRLAYNPDYERGEMLSSVQAGLRSLPEDAEAALVCLGDQPQVQVDVVRAVIDRYCSTRAGLVVPSYHNRRGHPWLAARALWPAILELAAPQTLRTFLNAHAAMTHYLSVETPSVLFDIDTPEDYARYTP